MRCSIAGSIVYSVAEKGMGASNYVTFYNPIVDREIVVIKIADVNTNNTLKGIPELLQTFREKGYTIYYPSLQFNFKEDSLVVDTLQRKYRKLASASYSYKDIYEMAFGRNFNGNSKENLGIADSIDIMQDWYLNDLIRVYENLKFDLILDSCDWKTPLSEKYACPNERNHHALAIEKYLRNEAMFHHLLTSDRKKVVVFLFVFNYFNDIQVLFNAGYYIKSSKV